jgi:hypothetical protein
LHPEMRPREHMEAQGNHTDFTPAGSRGWMSAPAFRLPYSCLGRLLDLLSGARNALRGRLYYMTSAGISRGGRRYVTCVRSQATSRRGESKTGGTSWAQVPGYHDPLQRSRNRPLGTVTYPGIKIRGAIRPDRRNRSGMIARGKWLRLLNRSPSRETRTKLRCAS